MAQVPRDERVPGGKERQASKPFIKPGFRCERTVASIMSHNEEGGDESRVG